MKVTKELIKAIGGLSIRREEGGGLVYEIDVGSGGDHRLMTFEETAKSCPADLRTLIRRIVLFAWNDGHYFGDQDAKHKMRKAMGLEK